MKALILSMVIFLASCATTRPIVSPRPEPTFSAVRPVTMEDYKWVIITKDNVDQYLKDGAIMMALSPGGYRALNGNQAEMRRYIRDQGAVIGAYKAYVASDKNK